MGPVGICFKTKIGVKVTPTGSKLWYEVDPEQKDLKKEVKNWQKTLGRPIFRGPNRGQSRGIPCGRLDNPLNIKYAPVGGPRIRKIADFRSLF